MSYILAPYPEADPAADLADAVPSLTAEIVNEMGVRTWAEAHAMGVNLYQSDDAHGTCDAVALTWGDLARLRRALAECEAARPANA